FTFKGVQVGFVTTVATGNGDADLSLDGGTTAVVHTHGPGSFGKVRYVTKVTAGISHSLVVTVVGTTGHPKVDVDAFVVIS
ncbi:MAG TPA: hypothetical protein VGL48_13750, partial [Acidimicrobiales bacterium]